MGCLDQVFKIMLLHKQTKTPWILSIESRDSQWKKFRACWINKGRNQEQTAGRISWSHGIWPRNLECRGIWSVGITGMLLCRYAVRTSHHPTPSLTATEFYREIFFPMNTHYQFFKINFYFMFIILAALCLHCCTQAFSSCGKRGLPSSCSAWASHCGVFSCCKAWALYALAQ